MTSDDDELYNRGDAEQPRSFANSKFIFLIPLILVSALFFYYLNVDINHLTQTTNNINDLIEFIRANFNESMLTETYVEYAVTKDMNETMGKLVESNEKILSLLNASKP